MDWNDFELDKLRYPRPRVPCSSCQQDMVFRFGENRRPHFAHLTTVQCDNRGGESELHRMAKHMLVEHLSSPGHSIDFKILGCCNESPLQTVRIEVENRGRVVEEHTLDNNGRADVAILDSDEKVTYVIEVTHTHSTEEYARDGLTWFDVSTQSIIAAWERNEWTDVRCNRKCSECFDRSNSRKRKRGEQHVLETIPANVIHAWREYVSINNHLSQTTDYTFTPSAIELFYQERDSDDGERPYIEKCWRRSDIIHPRAREYAERTGSCVVCLLKDGTNTYSRPTCISCYKKSSYNKFHNKLYYYSRYLTRYIYKYISNHIDSEDFEAVVYEDVGMFSDDSIDIIDELEDMLNNAATNQCKRKQTDIIENQQSEDEADDDDHAEHNNQVEEDHPDSRTLSCIQCGRTRNSHRLYPDGVVGMLSYHGLSSRNDIGVCPPCNQAGVNYPISAYDFKRRMYGDNYMRRLCDAGVLKQGDTKQYDGVSEPFELEFNGSMTMCMFQDVSCYNWYKVRALNILKCIQCNNTHVKAPKLFCPKCYYKTFKGDLGRRRVFLNIRLKNTEELEEFA